MAHTDNTITLPTPLATSVDSIRSTLCPEPPLSLEDSMHGPVRRTFSPLEASPPLRELSARSARLLKRQAAAEASVTAAAVASVAAVVVEPAAAVASSCDFASTAHSAIAATVSDAALETARCTAAVTRACARGRALQH